MNRRKFIKNMALTGAATGFPLLGLQSAKAQIATAFPDLGQRIVVFLCLPGGPDFRHLLPPALNSDEGSFGYRHWQARASSQGLDPADAASWNDRWMTDYSSFTHAGTEFGILNKADWLQTMWNSGNVAIVNNVVGATTRNHSHCQMVLDQGNVDSGVNDFNRSGWGGRLAQATNGNVISVTTTPRRFCFGDDPNNPQQISSDPLISIADSRNIALFEPAPGTEKNNPGKISRSLKGYYAAKKAEIDPDSIFKRFIDHEIKLRDVGAQVSSLLENEPIPAEIAALYSGDTPLNSAYFGKQIRNLRDSLALTDVLKLRTVSMEYGSWDSHKDQKDFIEPKLADIFGSGGGLDTLYQSLPATVADKLVFVIAGEFGRQLKSNGNQGTDHGRGNSMMIIGNEVNGASATSSSNIYGDMFPESELDRLNDSTPDIQGLTEIDHVLGAICDGVQTGLGDAVFPNRSSRMLEAGVDLSNLFG